MPPSLTRKAVPEDVPRLASLLRDYMRETYHGEWGGSAELLEQHMIQKEVEVIVWESDGDINGFVAWTAFYDLHWCVKGGMIVDLYVSLPSRGKGAAVFLVTRLAEEIRERGGAFLKGGPVESDAVHRLYKRVAMRLGDGDYYVSGKAFRHLSQLSGRNLRHIVRNLPEAAWNQLP